jgi:hypothetical protein
MTDHEYEVHQTSVWGRARITKRTAAGGWLRIAETENQEAIQEFIRQHEGQVKCFDARGKETPLLGGE